jgi:hypothetical protein
VSRLIDLSAAAISARHCTEFDCKKCRARFRWMRRKSWRSRKSVNRRSSLVDLTAVSLRAYPPLDCNLKASARTWTLPVGARHINARTGGNCGHQQSPTGNPNNF